LKIGESICASPNFVRYADDIDENYVYVNES